MRLIVKDENMAWTPEEILFLASAALQVSMEDPDGDGTYTRPFEMKTVGQWYKAAVEPPPKIKRAFYVIGGRLLHRRLNRNEKKYSDYITECGPWNETTKKKIDDAFRNRVERKLHVHVEPTTDQFQTERFDAPARWYTRAGSGVDDDGDLGALGGIGPTYNSLQDAIEKLLGGTYNDVSLAKQIRSCLMGAGAAPASVACLTAAWFLGEVKRHPRSLLSALVLLDMIEGMHSAHATELFHAEPFTFRHVIAKQAALPHPMSGKGTVEKAQAAQKRTGDLTAQLNVQWNSLPEDADVSKPDAISFNFKRALNVVEERESKILIRWLARRLHEHGLHGVHFDTADEKWKEKAKVTLGGRKLYYNGLITAEFWQRLDSFAPMT